MSIPITLLFCTLFIITISTDTVSSTLIIFVKYITVADVFVNFLCIVLTFNFNNELYLRLCSSLDTRFKVWWQRRSPIQFNSFNGQNECNLNRDKEQVHDDSHDGHHEKITSHAYAGDADNISMDEMENKANNFNDGHRASAVIIPIDDLEIHQDVKQDHNHLSVVQNNEIELTATATKEDYMDDDIEEEQEMELRTDMISVENIDS